MIAVQVKKLLVKYGPTIALDGVDLRVEPGELFLLLGPSGCGKTTLLRSIAGFVSADSGAIFFDEEDVTALSPSDRHTGMVFQSFALWPHLNVGENVAFGMRERRTARAEIDDRVQKALESVNLGGRAASSIDQLSGGEQQRVALARALVVRPRCLLLDEPLSNLDARLRHSMREEIRRVVKNFGLTAIYVTHDQKEALAIADRIAVMKGGRVLQVGTPTEIYRRPTSRTVAAFIGETNVLEGEVVSQNGDEVQLATKVGTLVSTASRPNAAPNLSGGKVWVSIRPECFRFGDAASSTVNILAGQLESTTYLGELSEHRIDVNGVSVRAYEFNPQGAPPLRDGRVSLSVAPRDVLLLPWED